MSSTNDTQRGEEPPAERELGGDKDFGFLPIPKSLQYDSDRPFEFTTLLNIIFGIASTFTVANLYYCQPLLIQFADSFGVSDDEVSRIPTLIQSGYAAGLLLLTPLGDLVRRRPLLLLLVFVSGTITIGLAITTSLPAFEFLCFLVGFASVSPQVLIPFAADLAPPHKRGAAISVVYSGLLLGILIARVLAGIVAQFVSWRVVFFVALGTQYVICIMLYLVLPDYPAKNAKGGLTYFGILRTMAHLALTEPVLMQAGLISIASSAVFSSFWVTLTFLLGGPLYNYSTLDIGLFGLIGMLGVMTAPITGRIVDRLVPWMATFLATFVLISSQAIETAIGGVSIAGPVIACFGLDLGRQMQQVSLTTAVYSVKPEARSRLNAVLILWIFLGQVMGTSVGAKVYNEFGWRANAGLSLAWMGWQFLLLFARGPHAGERTWLGWEGGWGRLTRENLGGKGVEKADVEVASQEDVVGEAREDEKGDVKGEKQEGSGVTAEEKETASYPRGSEEKGSITMDGNGEEGEPEKPVDHSETRGAATL